MSARSAPQKLSEDTLRTISGSSPSFTELRRCRECGRTQDGEIRLQRCAGCFHVLYCSRSCQKKGWKMHKSLCRANANALANPQSGWDRELHVLGFDSISAFSDALGQWLDAHKCALELCADVAIMKGGGFDSFQSPQKMLFFALIPRSSTDLPSSRNPSLTFQLKDSALFTIEDHFPKGHGFWRDWELAAATRAAMNEKYASHPLYAGLLPILLSVEGFSLSQTAYFPQFRPHPAWRPRAGMLAAGKHAVLSDMLSLIQGSINEGFPLRSTGHDPRVAPLPGCFVRSNGTWTWQQLFPDWSEYRRGQHRGLDQTLDAFQSVISPDELMVLFKTL